MRDDGTLLLDIRDAIEIVRRYTPADRATLDTDLPVQSLLIRYLQIIGEASWRLSDALKARHPQVPWPRIAAMRHVLVHDYFRVDLNQVWNVATIHVPVLKPQIDAICASLPPTTTTPQFDSGEYAVAKIAILVEKIYEDLELQYPRLRLKEAGHTVEIIGPKAGETYVGKHGYPQKSEKAAADVKATDYQLIVIPGGSSPDHMRRDGGMVKLVRDAAVAKIPMAAICHGPWMLCSTDVLRGRRCTSYMSIAHDVVNAGGKWVDEECVVDGDAKGGAIITARCPDDLPSFSNAILEMVSEGKAKGVKGKPIAPAWLMETIPASARG